MVLEVAHVTVLPGLYVLERACREDMPHLTGSGVALTTVHQALTLVASVPLTDEQRSRIVEWLSTEIQAAGQVRSADRSHSSFRRLTKYEGGGTLCAFSSVAGERGRKPVVLYGATKAGLSAYLEGLDHRHRANGLKVVCVKPGFVKTTMTEGLKPPPFAGEPEALKGRFPEAHVIRRLAGI